MGVSGKILREKEIERRIKIPSSLFHLKSLKELDKKLETGNLYIVSQFYQNYPNILDESSFRMLEKVLSSPRKSLSKEDLDLIKKISNSCKESQDLFLDFTGNMVYISETLEELKKFPNISKTLKVSVMLYSFLNLIELTSKYLGELMIYKIKNENLEKKFKGFLKKFEDGKHAEMGHLIKTLKELFKLDEKFMKKTLFGESKMIRNIIAHSNLFYDSKKDKIYQSNSKEYSFERFEGEFNRLFEFLLELLFKLNNSSNNLWKGIQTIFAGMSKKFLGYSRAGLNKKFNQVIINFLKDD